MNKQFQFISVLVSLAIVMIGLVACDKQGREFKGDKLWKGEVIAHANFCDLGNYVIELPTLGDPAIVEKGREAMNALSDFGQIPTFGCTAMVKRNRKGEVVFGRNMDLDISQKPAYVFRTSCGRYKTFCVSYLPTSYYNYAQLQQMDSIPEEMLPFLTFMASDCINEKGLYIEDNLREFSERHINYGLHTANGEKYREDGTPWENLRAHTVMLPMVVAQNCATVQEALAYIRNSYDWYTFTPEPGKKAPLDRNNMAFLIGDATGEYGLIELAQDEVYYMPYQYGHANCYLAPKLSEMETLGAGIGRLDMVSKMIGSYETMEEAMDAMKPIMWRNETLWVGESKRVTDGSKSNPYNQIVFQDIDGNPSLDWRSEYVAYGTVLDDGRMIITRQQYQDAVQSTYDPMIKHYVDDALASGFLIVEDGSLRFEANGQKLTLTQLQQKHDIFKASSDSAQRAQLLPYYRAYRHLQENMNNLWNHNDFHFEAIKAFAYARMHIRRNAEGKMDPQCMSKYEKLCAFYGFGMEKDEKPLRDDASIWTTSLNVGANCMTKEMKIRFWENDTLVYHVHL